MVLLARGEAHSNGAGIFGGLDDPPGDVLGRGFNTLLDSTRNIKFVVFYIIFYHVVNRGISRFCRVGDPMPLVDRRKRITEKRCNFRSIDIVSQLYLNTSKIKLI